MPTRVAWRNRITGHGEESPTALVANPANWRQHPRRQADALAGVLNEVGWVQDVIVNRTTGHLIDGHLRVALAVERKEPTIPVVYVDLTPAEEALILATLDPLSAMAETDVAKLRGLLDEVSTGEAAVQEMLAGIAAEAIEAYGDATSATDARGSVWDRIQSGDKCKVIIGDMESHIPIELAKRLEAYATAAYEQDRVPIPDTLAAVIENGMDGS